MPWRSREIERTDWAELGEHKAARGVDLEYVATAGRARRARSLLWAHREAQVARQHDDLAHGHMEQAACGRAVSRSGERMGERAAQAERGLHGWDTPQRSKGRDRA